MILLRHKLPTAMVYGSLCFSGGAALGCSDGSSARDTGWDAGSGGTAQAASGGNFGTTGGTFDPGSGSGGSESGGMASGGSASGGALGSGGANGDPASCPAQMLSSGDTTRMVTVNGETRQYILHVPAAYSGTQAVPLIVDFHPLGGSGAGERTSSPYPAVTDKEGVILAFPSGKSGPSAGAWNVGPCCVAAVDDVAFARELVEDVSSVACIDKGRVYAAGFSMGGGMSHYLACHAADVFAAVAPAAFDLLEENVDSCKPARAISVISFRSTGDFVVPYGGGASSAVPGMPVNFLGAQKTFETWGKKNECATEPTKEPGSGCESYAGCRDDVDVVLCTTQGGGHDYGNASIAWPLLSAHRLEPSP